MSTHPWTHHEIARLRHEERLTRARAHHVRAEVDELASERRRSALERLFSLPRIRVRASARGAITGAVRPLS